MTSFVFCHFMNGVMDSVEVELFSEGCDFFLACASALFSSSTHFEVGLGVVRNDFAEAKTYPVLSCLLPFPMKAASVSLLL